jgi:hypothetical protein
MLLLLLGYTYVQQKHMLYRPCGLPWTSNVNTPKTLIRCPSQPFVSYIIRAIIYLPVSLYILLSCIYTVELCALDKAIYWSLDKYNMFLYFIIEDGGGSIAKRFWAAHFKQYRKVKRCDESFDKYRIATTNAVMMCIGKSLSYIAYTYIWWRCIG